MKEREIYADIRALSPVLVRLDGRAFHTLSRQMEFVRPYDERFSSAMEETAILLLQDSGLAPLFAYTFSDEISLYFPIIPFDGRIEKVTSVTASFAASSLTFSLKPEFPVAFDARIIPITPNLLIDYLSWRQDEAWRNHINAWSQSLALKEGRDTEETARILHKMSAAALHEFCFKRGVNLAQTPSWQRRGTLIYKMSHTKPGFNPLTGQKTEAIRKKVRADHETPLFTSDEGRKLLDRILREGDSKGN